MNGTNLLHDAYGWTAKRVAAVRAADLDARTPCTEWDLRQLLNHLVGALDLHLDAVAGIRVDLSLADPGLDRIGDDPASAFGVVADRAARVWAEPGALDRTCPMPFGPTPASAVIAMHLTEVVLHGWDVRRATGENAFIPDQLAEPVFLLGKPLVTTAHRGTAFVDEQPAGRTPESRLLAFYGRTP